MGLGDLWRALFQHPRVRAELERRLRPYVEVAQASARRAADDYPPTAFGRYLRERDAQLLDPPPEK